MELTGKLAKILLEFSNNDDCSDLHLRTNQHPYFRVNGVLSPNVDYQALTEEESKEFVAGLIKIRYGNKDVSNDIIEMVNNSNKELDMSITLPNGGNRARVNIFLNNFKLAVVLRKIPKEIPNIETLGFFNEHINKINEISNKKEGLILVTGQTGSGKSTTLAAILKMINETRQRHIITIEDPIEFYHENKKSLITHREVGKFSDTSSFESGIRASLREDPDVILIGEMRDAETAIAAIQAAQTGHIVLATLHTNSVAESITRLVDMFPSDKAKSIKASLANSLSMIISQRLVPNTIGKRTLAYELMVSNNAVKNLITEDVIKTTRILEQMTQNMNTSDVMLPLNYCLKRLINEKNDSKRITKKTALEYTYDKPGLSSLIKDIQGDIEEKHYQETTTTKAGSLWV